MTEIEVLKWIKDNLGSIISKSITVESPVIYTEDWLAAIVMRETAFLINRYVSKGLDFNSVCQLMRGDFTQRQGEKERQYHGFSFFQIDIASYPDFISSGQWKDPYLSCLKAISVLEGKRRYLQGRFKLLSGEPLERAITAAYNCGEGNVSKSIISDASVDTYTTGKNYSKEVFRFRDIYKQLKSD